MRCHICKAENPERFLSLGHQPPSDAFLKREELERPEISYPLDVYFCSACSLVQLGYTVDPEILFRDYVYNTGTNNALRANFKELVDEIIKAYSLKKDDFVVDIGSNDGTLLENYAPRGIRALGIDPSSATNIAIEKGIPTDVVFFNESEAQTVAERDGKPKVITATNVFAHVKELDSFMRGVTTLLAPNGVFISESGYVVDMIEGMQYDSIYHEHLRYYSVTSLAVHFERFQMEIVNVERIPSHGGSIRVYAARKGAHPASPSVQKLVSMEKQKGYTALPIYTKFAKDIAKTKSALLGIIFGLKKKNYRIAGIGAPAKGNTILNYCKLDTDMIGYLAEKSALKIGLYSPGMHIPVAHESRLCEDQPEAALLLSWNLADELMPKFRKAGFRGQFIVPNPIPRLV